MAVGGVDCQDGSEVVGYMILAGPTACRQLIPPAAFHKVRHYDLPKQHLPLETKHSDTGEDVRLLISNLENILTL